MGPAHLIPSPSASVAKEEQYLRDLREVIEKTEKQVADYAVTQPERDKNALELSVQQKSIDLNKAMLEEQENILKSNHEDILASNLDVEAKKKEQKKASDSLSLVLENVILKQDEEKKLKKSNNDLKVEGGLLETKNKEQLAANAAQAKEHADLLEKYTKNTNDQIRLVQKTKDELETIKQTHEETQKNEIEKFNKLIESKCIELDKARKDVLDARQELKEVNDEKLAEEANVKTLADTKQTIVDENDALKASNQVEKNEHAERMTIYDQREASIDQHKRSVFVEIAKILKDKKMVIDQELIDSINKV